MDIEVLREICVGKIGVTESFPFDENTLVFKVGGKMFLLIDLANPVAFNAKCNPEKAVQLREEYDEVTPGYHMNKVHWNTVNMQGRLSFQQLKELIDHSYDLVFNSLPKKLRDGIIMNPDEKRASK
ncbi:MmcQ/YjbR family DNA-binding protein [Desertivirga arenae]|uniref:MmcQ/YjbR family DNA-binding protein n=1 Tax=Desertivirga arenae TaxID=2810309 RepID=UPI001A956BD2|nr:MmcQ/YjbR family DNA-binding protein [Pedobacter sp. SYSU D00823]